MYNPFSLEGKTVLVTGASSGIGQATAIECSKMGAKLIITGRNTERLNETFQQLDGPDRGHRQIVADMLQQSDMDLFLSQVDELNGVALCAGLGKILPFTYCSREKYNEIFEINFFGTIELLRSLYKQKKICKKGSVVLITSIGGTRRITPGNAIYGASKAALKSTTKFCAKEFAQREIRVNAVAPGMVKTPLIASGTLTEEQYQEDMKSYAIKRYGEPKEIAYGIIYLLSDASSWITGTSLVIDGGSTI